MNQCPRMFCFGLGYVGLRLARQLRRRGWEIAGTTRNEEYYHRLEMEKIETHFFRFGHAGVQLDMMLAGTTHLLICIPPDKLGDPVFRECRLAVQMLPDLQWIGYLSTTGVYGDCHGEWVDETMPVAPDTERSRWRVEAERQWLGFGKAFGLPVHIFRLSAIYGSGRSAIDHLRDGTARCIIKENHVFSRMHVADIVTTLEASMMNPMAGEIYNLADDEPSAHCHVVRYAAELLQVPPPPPEPFETAELSDRMRGFYLSSRKISNNKIKSELGVELAYPTYREGLAAILAE